MEPWDKNRKLLKNYGYWSKEQGFFFFLSFFHWQHIAVHNEVATSVKHRLLDQFGSFTLLTTAFTATALKFIHTLDKFLITGLHFLSAFSRPFPWWPCKINRTDVWSVPGYWNMAGHQSDFRKKLSINKTKQNNIKSDAAMRQYWQHPDSSFTMSISSPWTNDAQDLEFSNMLGLGRSIWSV